MALLKFNPHNLNLELTVGILEEYKPSEEIRQLHNDVEKVRSHLDKFIKKHWKDMPVMEIKKRLAKEPKEEEKFKKYIKNTHQPKLVKLIQRIDKINHKICPNYKDRS